MLSFIKERLAAGTDSEPQQAILRVCIGSLIVAHVTLYLGPRDGWTNLEVALALGLAGFMVIAIGIVVAIVISPAKSIARRVFGICADAGLATFYLWLAAENGVLMIAVYLFVIIGNGFRYGLRYLYAAQLLCIFGFTSALVAVPYWQQHRAEGLNLLVTLVVIPFYLALLLKRVLAVHARAEQALRARVEHDGLGATS